MSTLLIFILVLPLVAAGLSALLRSGKLATWITVVSTLGLSSMASIVALRVARGATAVAVPGWIACDPSGALVLWLISFVALTTALFSLGLLDRPAAAHSPARLWRFYVGFNLFVLSLVAIPLLQELAMVWTAVALTTLLSAFLVAFESTEEALEAAWKYVTLTSLGATVALAGILLLHFAARAAGGAPFTWTGLARIAPHLPAPVVATAFLFILVGLGAKVGLVPLHTWLPEAYSQAPLPVCVLLSGGEATAVLYVLLRFLPVGAGAHVDVHSWILVTGLVSAGVAALLLLQAKDLKRLLAFSTIEHMGIVLVAAGLGSHAGVAGATLQLTGHALVKSFCFFAAGLAILAAGTRQMDDMRGLIRTSPVAGIGLLAGSLAISGVPPFALFLSEISIFHAGLSTGHGVAIGLLALFVGVAFWAILSRVNRMVFGQPSETAPRPRPPIPSLIALGMTAIPVLALGLYLPPRVVALLRLAARALGGS